jgi:hypothetical protein
MRGASVTRTRKLEFRHLLAKAWLRPGRKRAHDAAEAMARITAKRLVRRLQQFGFVIMKSPAAVAPTTNMPPSAG